MVILLVSGFLPRSIVGSLILFKVDIFLYVPKGSYTKGLRPLWNVLFVVVAKIHFKMKIHVSNHMIKVHLDILRTDIVCINVTSVSLKVNSLIH